MTAKKEWIPKWGPTCPNVITLHDVCGGWSALRHGSGEGPIRVGRDEEERLAAMFVLAPVVVVAATTEPRALEELCRAHRVDLRIAGGDLPSPLTDTSRAESPVRWLAAYAASFAFGGSCVSIQVDETLRLDFVDDEGRYRSGRSVQPNSDAQVTKRVLDDAIRALVEAEAGCEGPLLVVTGPSTSELVAQGGLPMTDVPVLLHRGLVELWRSTQA